MLIATWKRNDRKAHILIWIFSAIVFLAVTILDRITLSVNPGFDPHIFATCSAAINSIVTVLLIAAFLLVMANRFLWHKRVMLATMALSVLFLVFYILHHLFTGETRFGDLNHDGWLSEQEKVVAGNLRFVYYFIISTHITLAGVVMPFVLYSAYHALYGNYERHKKLVRFTFPVWLYVSITGVLVYLMISPYY